jgi:hypothetical protein
MGSGLEIVNPIGSPFLERVAKEERIRRDLPRRSRDGKSSQAREDPGEEHADEPGESMSSTHIDLRI